MPIGCSLLAIRRLGVAWRIVRREAKDDPRSIKVFDPSIKDETDRFAYWFGKL
jgi:hypothetical protein